MVRPTKDPGDRHTRRAMLAFTPNEWRRIRRRVTAARLPVAVYLRGLILAALAQRRGKA